MEQPPLDAPERYCSSCSVQQHSSGSNSQISHQAAVIKATGPSAGNGQLTLPLALQQHGSLATSLEVPCWHVYFHRASLPDVSALGVLDELGICDRPPQGHCVSAANQHCVVLLTMRQGCQNNGRHSLLRMMITKGNMYGHCRHSSLVAWKQM